MISSQHRLCCGLLKSKTKVLTYSSVGRHLYFWNSFITFLDAFVCAGFGGFAQAAVVMQSGGRSFSFVFVFRLFGFEIVGGFTGFHFGSTFKRLCIQQITYCEVYLLYFKCTKHSVT